MPFGFFKGKDGAHTLGPCLVTADELEPYRTPDGLLDLTMRAWINDEPGKARPAPGTRH